MLRSFSRLAASAALRTRPAATVRAVVGATQRRHASFYNADVAGLTEEQAEVCRRFICAAQTLLLMKLYYPPLRSIQTVQECRA